MTIFRQFQCSNYIRSYLFNYDHLTFLRLILKSAELGMCQRVKQKKSKKRMMM